MNRYLVTMSTIIFGDFYDSGDAIRYAKSLSNRNPTNLVEVTRQGGALVAMKDRLLSVVEFRNGKQVF